MYHSRCNEEYLCKLRLPLIYPSHYTKADYSVILSTANDFLHVWTKDEGLVAMSATRPTSVGSVAGTYMFELCRVTAFDVTERWISLHNSRRDQAVQLMSVSWVSYISISCILPQEDTFRGPVDLNTSDRKVGFRSSS